MEIIEEKYINELIDYLISVDAIEERAVIIEGQHPDLGKYAEWYSGATSWHNYFGRTNGVTVTKQKNQSQLCKMICEAVASNFANEKTSVTIPNKAQQEAMNKMMIKFFKNWSKFVEKYQALGLGATVVMPEVITYDVNTSQVERSKNNKVRIYTIDAPRIIPITVDEDGVQEVLFIRESTNKITLQIHLKREDGNYVVAEVDGKKKSKGSKDLVFDYSQTKILTIQETPLFQIWYPNIADNVHLDRKVGISRFANAIEWVKMVDEVLTSFYTEFKNGKKKRFVSVDLEHVDSTGARTLELDDEDIVIPQGRDKSNLLQEFNGELRAQPHVLGINFALSGASKAAGLGVGDFVFDPSQGAGRPIQTATGAIIKETEKYRTIMKEEALAEENLKNMLMAIKFVNNTFVQSKINYTFDFEKIQITFDDNIKEDTEAKKKIALQEYQSGLLAGYEYRVAFFDEDEETAKKKMQENGLNIDRYSNAMINGLITPKQWIDIVFGKNVQDASELEEILQQKVVPMADPMDYMMTDEADLNEKKQEQGGDE